MSLPIELAKARDQIEQYARDFGLDFFDTIFEMVDAEQINSLAAYGGFPVRYPHWRFGMDYDQFSKGHTWGFQKIYEMVINTDPAFAYLVKSNSLTVNKLVIAHVYGHVDFFKNNYWFSKTNRRMLDIMANHAVKVRELMDIYGQDEVENFIDLCLSVENLIDPYLPFEPKKDKKKEDHDPRTEKNKNVKLKSDRQYMESFINPKEFVEEQREKQKEKAKKEKRYPINNQKDVLLFLLNNAPLESWQQTVLNIVRDEAYYFVPQMQTKIMNEGWASYWHSKIMTQKAMQDTEVVDFADTHSGAMAMNPGQINPYKVGIELFRDIEDRWNKGKFGKEYDECDDLRLKEKWDKKLGLGRDKIFEVRRVCNDVTFIDEYLTPEFCERLKMYNYEFNRRTNQYEIVDKDFKKVKDKQLQMLTNMGQPFIYVNDANYENRGELLLWHKHLGFDLDPQYAHATMTALEKLWSRPVNIETIAEGQRKLLSVKNGEFTEKNLDTKK